jgi:hypothetical protein
MTIAELRKEYHQILCEDVIRIHYNKKKDIEFPNFADGSNRASVNIAWGIVDRLSCELNRTALHEQTVGGRFERITEEFLEKAFSLLNHLRPGTWYYSTKTYISEFDQYEHLSDLARIVKAEKDLQSALGGDYFVKPDIVVGRWPVSDEEINQNTNVLGEEGTIANFTPLRASNLSKPRKILHASISCKWTIRSDRSQNTRTESLNLIRNRKGHLPHIVAVTAEPLPTRIATLALGTGDLDCVYHFALPELQRALTEAKNEDQLDLLSMMTGGRRLRDISDLPFDLAI